MKGTIIRRGKSSWRLKYDLPRDSETSERRIAYKTVRGKRADAEAELRAILHKIDRGVSIDPSRITIAEYLNDWLTTVVPHRVAPKALERYRGLVRNQINPFLGHIELQKVRPRDIDRWLKDLLAESKLAPRTIRHAHGVLRTALNHAAAIELIERNVATLVKPPTSERKVVEILTAEQVVDALDKLRDHPSLFPIVTVALSTGARRGEIAALRWGDIDLEAATVRIERALEQTAEGLRVKAPKTAAGRRTVSLPAFAVAALRDHRRETLEQRLALGIGALPADAPVFGDHEGNWPSPYSISDRWRNAVKNRKLPKVTFHALRHSHASALIAAGLDVVAVSRRLGHASPALTLSVYSHLFSTNDDKAAAAIDAALGCQSGASSTRSDA